MRKITALALTVVPLLLLTASADAKKPRCRIPKGGVERAHTKRVLVFQRDDEVQACLRPNGRRYQLSSDDGIYNTVTVDAISGTFVTWTETYTPECKADCPPGVTGHTTTFTINLRTGHITQ